MKVSGVLNNNALIAIDHKNEVVVFGTGIGYRAKKGDTVDENKIQAIYVNTSSDFVLLKSRIPDNILEIVNDIFFLAKEKGLKLSDAMFFSLADHINASIKRKYKNIELQNPFKYELETYFPDEWSVAIQSKEIIKKKTNIEFGEDELGYIALHLLEEDKLVENVGVKKAMRIIDDVMAIAISNLELDNVEISTSFQYSRLLTHIKLFAYRFMQDEQLKDTKDLCLDQILGNLFDIELNCIKNIEEYLLDRYGKKITNQEILYLAIHFKNCRLMSKSNNH